MRIDEAIEYITSASWSQWRLGLERTYELLERVGNPDRQLKFVHVAGTNGKGSVCAMTESMLRAAGYTTGCYPSPYIEDFRERIQVNAEPISEEELCELTEVVKAEADMMEDHPSQFEIITAIGMLYFARKNCDIVVLEVGLGGTYDSTNVIEVPEVAVITNIGYDHREYLGDTLAEITRTKCGIIKSGSDVVAYPNAKEVTDVIEAVCREKGCRLDYADFARIEPLTADLSGQTFRFRHPERKRFFDSADGLAQNDKSTCHPERSTAPTCHPERSVAEPKDLLLRLPLIGEYQLRNAAVALTIIERLRDRGWNISDDAVVKGMADVRWPARFEVLGLDPVFILDGGHNKQCAEAVAESLKKYFPDGGLTLIIGMLRDKDYKAAVDLLLPYADKVYCVTPDSDRALPAEELATIINGKKILRLGQEPSLRMTGRAGPAAVAFDSAGDAVKEALAGTAPVLAFGSLYLAGRIRKAYRELH